MVIDRLSWDSSFFGFEVGKVRENAKPCSAGQVRLAMRESGFRLAYWSTSEMHAELNREFIVSQVLLAARPSELTCVNDQDCALLSQSYAVSPPDESLVQLALDAGWSSRFRLDPRVSDEQFSSMYQTWIRRSCLREISDELFIVNDGHRLAGFVTVACRDVDCQIGLIAVSEGCRGRGIGKQLLSAAAKFALDTRAETLRVVTQENNIAALRLYESVGFELIERKHWYHIWCDDLE